MCAGATPSVQVTVRNIGRSPRHVACSAATLVALVHDLLCFSQFRWDTALPRAQRLLARAARNRRVFFVEEPEYDDGRAHLILRRTPEGVIVVVPTLPRGTGPRRGSTMQRELIDHLAAFQDLRRYVLWYWNPTAVTFTDRLRPSAVIYDCVEEPRKSHQPQAEQLLLASADVVFAANPAIYQLKRSVHGNVHIFEGISSDPAAWDRTWHAMDRLISRCVDDRTAPAVATV